LVKQPRSEQRVTARHSPARADTFDQARRHRTIKTHRPSACFHVRDEEVVAEAGTPVAPSLPARRHADPRSAPNTSGVVLLAQAVHADQVGRARGPGR
jgi:hypothetical protein